MKLCLAKSVAEQVRWLVPEFGAFNIRGWHVGTVVAACCGVLIVAALFAQAVTAQTGGLGGGLPADLETARQQMTLEQRASQAFHMEMTFESTSDTGVVSRGSVEEDWWNDQWSRQAIVVNGLRREVLTLGGTVYRDEPDGFVLPLRVRSLLLAAQHPFPQRPQPPGTEKILPLEQVRMHCFTLPAATEVPDLKPAAKTFCVDESKNLRMTADPDYRVLYNDVTTVGTHQVARTVRMLAGIEPVASLHVTRLTLRTDGPQELQQMSTDEQIRFALANPRVTVALRPASMQRQLLSTDVRMTAQGGVALKEFQKFAIVRVLEADGHLLDAEVMGASDAASRALAIRILNRAVFRVPTQQAHAIAYEGTLLLSPP